MDEKWKITCANGTRECCALVFVVFCNDLEFSHLKKYCMRSQMNRYSFRFSIVVTRVHRSKGSISKRDRKNGKPREMALLTSNGSTPSATQVKDSREMHLRLFVTIESNETLRYHRAIALVIRMSRLGFRRTQFSSGHIAHRLHTWCWNTVQYAPTRVRPITDAVHHKQNTDAMLKTSKEKHTKISK